MNRKNLFLLLFLVCGVWMSAGCSQQTSAPTGAQQLTSSSAPAVDGTKFLLTTEPEGAGDVIKVREGAGDGDDIVIVGRIGGSANPWVEGRAAFSIVDGSLRACSDIEGDSCPIPWDYCCETSKLPTATALVKVVDETGALVKADARELLSVKELSTVVVEGRARRDDAGNLTVLATGVFVKKM
ncbi:MAG: hypothetical protein GY758_25875 [Fuerstiella sp.]|jgi:hypothetical protein|nr:hypothetical protein [Fuerstiella sp.]MCP4506609.1 hypothetical protein [Fuerstiella sp.]MDG2127288.1 hypothetical protein [Fuerstiella sp.]